MVMEKNRDMGREAWDTQFLYTKGKPNYNTMDSFHAFINSKPHNIENVFVNIG